MKLPIYNLISLNSVLYDSQKQPMQAPVQGRIWGGGGLRTPSPLRDSTPCRPPFDTFSEIHYFFRNPLEIYTNFEGERAPKKRDFFVKIFQKLPKNGFFDCFFSKICLRRRKFCQIRGKSVLWKSSKNQFGRPKKKRSKFWNFF